MTWKELKDFCNQLSEEQLESPIFLIREDEVVGDIYAESLDEDMYYASDHSQYGWMTKDQMKGLIADMPEDFPGGESHFEITDKAGDTFLWEEF